MNQQGSSAYRKALLIIGTPWFRYFLLAATPVYLILFTYYYFYGPIDIKTPLLRLRVDVLWKSITQFVGLYSLLSLSFWLKGRESFRNFVVGQWIVLTAILFAVFLTTLIGGGISLKLFGPPLIYQRSLIVMSQVTGAIYLLLLATLFFLKRELFDPARHLHSFSFLLLFLPCLIIYMANGYAVFGGDTMFNVRLAQRLIHGAGFFYDQSYVDQHGIWGLLKVNDKYLPVWPMGAGFFALPTALLQNVLGVEPSHMADSLSQKVTSVWVTALSVAIMFEVVYLVSRDKSLSIILTVGFAFGTTQATMSAVTLWQHGPGVLLIVLGLLLLIRGRMEDNPKLLALAALPLAFLPAVRSQAALFYFAGLIAVGLIRPRSIINYLLWSIPGAALALWINLGLYEHLLGGYVHFSKAGHFSHPIFHGLAGLYFSPNRGMFIFSPFLIFGLFGALILIWKRSIIGASFFIASIGFMLIHAKWDEWYAGWCIGPRFNTETLPVMIFLCAHFFNHIKHAAYKYFMYALVAISIAITFPGFIYPHQLGQWNAFPDVNRNRDRFWDYKDWLPLHFRHRVALERFNEAPARAFVFNEWLDSVKSDKYYYSVKARLHKDQQRILELPQVYLKKGSYKFIIKGSSGENAQGSATLSIDMIYRRNTDYTLEIPQGRSFELSQTFQVKKDGYMQARLTASGDGDVIFDSVQIVPVGDGEL